MNAYARQCFATLQSHDQFRVTRQHQTPGRIILRVEAPATPWPVDVTHALHRVAPAAFPLGRHAYAHGIDLTHYEAGRIQEDLTALLGKPVTVQHAY